MILLHKVLKPTDLRYRYDLGVINLFVNFTNIIH